MADNEIKAQIDKLRKTRPARAVEVLYGDPITGESRDRRGLLVDALSMLRDDLKEEARLLEQAKIKGGTTIMRDRLAVAGWLELFVLQLGRESEVESTSKTVTGQLLEEWRGARVELAAIEASEHPDLIDKHGRVWVFWTGGGDAPLYRHDKGLAKPATMVMGEDTGLPKAILADNPNYRLCSICTAEWPTPTLWTQEELRPPLGDFPNERLSPSIELGEHRPSERGSDAAVLPGPGGRCAVGNVHDGSTLKCPCGLDRTTSVELASAAVFPPSPEKVADGKAITDYLSGVSDQLDAAVFDTLPHGISLAGAAINGSDEIPGAREFVDSLPSASMTIVADAAAYIGDAPAQAEQAAHDTIDRELAHVTADPFALPADPFAPIPVQTYAPRTPPGGRALTTLDLLTPIDAALLPAHVSFSQLNTVADCGVKYRLQRVEQVPQVPQWANVGGTTFHKCVETIERYGMQEKLTDAATIVNLWLVELEAQIVVAEGDGGMTRDQFRASGQGRENYDWWRVEGALMLQRYVDWRRSEHGASQQLLLGPGGAPMLEWEITYDVDGVPFKTILDSVWTDATQGLVQGRTAIIRDWKTGSMTPDDRQLCTQAWGLRKAGWQGEILVQFFDARKGTFSEPFDPFARMTWDDVRYFVLSGDAERKLPIPSARPSDFCGGCPVAYACPIMGQRRTAKVAK
jgi:hypothetical protein